MYLIWIASQVVKNCLSLSKNTEIDMHIRIGTRKSKLALIQTEICINKIKEIYPDISYEVIPITTTGDHITDKNLYDIGGKALFLKELEEALLANKIDIAVHSLKDVPGIVPETFNIAAVLEREDPRDVFISTKYKTIQDLPQGAIIGTSSVRRKVIMQQIRPDLKYVPFRGNVNTRLAKLERGEVDATILAMAGIKRLGIYDANICHPLEPDLMLPACGQGVIAIEIRANDQNMQDLCSKINHVKTYHLIIAERSFLKEADASCDTPIAAYATYLPDGRIEARYMMSNIQGSDIRYTTKRGPALAANDMGKGAYNEVFRG